jgi:hypothetical protein
MINTQNTLTDMVIEIEKKCQNCGKLLEDAFLTHCSNECRFEDYLNSQSIQKIISR